MNWHFSLPLLLSGSLLFYACQPTPVGGTLEQTYWDLTGIKTEEGQLSPDDSLGIYIHFDGKRLSGQAPCNRFAADFSTLEAEMSVSPILTTRQMCPEMELETVFLESLKNVRAYSVFKDLLILYPEKGQLLFMPMPESRIRSKEYEEGIGKLEALFPEMPVQDTLHLFPIIRVDHPGNYPFRGRLIDPSFYDYFDSDSREIWNSTGGDVLAVGHYGNLFICRVPGRYVSSDIALFVMEKEGLVRKETVAWAWCDEGWCNQQDAWLVYADRDSLFQIVQHYTLTDDQGKIQEERMTVLRPSTNGNFRPDPKTQPEKRLFSMASI